MFALVDGQLAPEEAEEWVNDHELDTDEGLTLMITWLREFRPNPDEEMPYD
jgi:hypothetical protein